jgi:hypothetical protein
MGKSGPLEGSIFGHPRGRPSQKSTPERMPEPAPTIPHADARTECTPGRVEGLRNQHVVTLRVYCEMFAVFGCLCLCRKVPGLPEPGVELSGGRAWSRRAVEKWAKATRRTIKDQGYSRAKRPAREAVPIRSLAARSRRSWQKQFYPAPAVQLGHPPVGTNPRRGDCGTWGNLPDFHKRSRGAHA